MDVTSYLLGKKAGGGGTPAVLEEKQVTVTTNGETTITPSTGYDGISSVDLTTNVQPNLESKSITINTNTTTTITPTEGKDGLSSVEVITAVPSQKFGFTNGGGFSFSAITRSNLQNDLNNIITNVNLSTITSTKGMFQNCSNLTSIDLSNFNIPNVVNMAQMFNNCSSLTSLDLSNINASNVTTMEGLFQNCSNLTSIILPNNINNQNGVYLRTMFMTCSKLTTLDLSNINTIATDVGYMFHNCKLLTHIDIRNCDFSQITEWNSYAVMFGNDANSGPPNNCEIIVKDNTQKQWITNNFKRLTNVKTVAEYEGS